MTQTVPATAVLGPGMTGLAIGVTVLNVDGTEYAAFSTSGVAETSVAGTYRKASGVVVPDAGGYLVWGVSGTDYAEATVDPKPAYAGDNMGLSDDAITSAKFDESTAFPLKAADSGNTYIARTGADGDTLETLSDQIDGIGGGGAPSVADIIAGLQAEDPPIPANVTYLTGSPASAWATAADMATVLARLGAWTGTGVNTLLGAFKALLSKTASAPSDIGGTFDPAADSVEALRDRGDAAWITATGFATVDGLEAVLANSGSTVTVVSAVSGGDIAVYANDTWEFTITSALLSLSGYETLALVVKRKEADDDDDAILNLRTSTGLVRINGAAPISAGNGTLTNDATSFTGQVAIAETVGVTARKYTWWLKGFDTTPSPNEGFTLATGGFTVKAPGLQAIS